MVPAAEGDKVRTKLCAEHLPHEAAVVTKLQIAIFFSVANGIRTEVGQLRKTLCPLYRIPREFVVVNSPEKIDNFGLIFNASIAFGLDCILGKWNAGSSK